VRRCVVRRLVRRLISRLVAVFVQFLLKDLHQSITNSTNDLDINVADPEGWYFGDLSFIILFIGILPLYAINLGDDVSLFADSPFTFLAMFASDIFYRFE